MTRNSENIRNTGLARALSKLGYCSRSQAFRMIRDGLIRVNGKTVRDPERPIALGRDVIETSAGLLEAARKTYLMMNKPRGTVTTARDEKGRKTIYTLLLELTSWVAPVGRLDMASEGLLLLTNDSEWGARIASPQSHIEKTYHVQIAAVAGQDLVDRLKRGVRTREGDFLSVKRVAILRLGGKNSWLEIVLDEGKNRHIRRMLEALGFEVLRLVRVAIGNLQLGTLPKGKTRNLNEKEIRSLTITSRQSRVIG